MAITKISSAEQYDNLISTENINVLLFSTDWAEQCSQILIVMEELSSKPEYKTLQFIEIPAEELSDIALKHKIEAVPTVIFIQNNREIHRIDGVDIGALTINCQKLATADPTEYNLESRLKSLINKGNVTIFMKGDRTNPRCGFSKQLINIINETGITYETFDILTDEEVRQGLKAYSDWPTYPQVYVKGELIGGLDIIKELLTNGELISTLQS